LTKNGNRFDEVRFLRSWIEKPLSMGRHPSSKVLARNMARYVDPTTMVR